MGARTCVSRVSTHSQDAFNQVGSRKIDHSVNNNECHALTLSILRYRELSTLIAEVDSGAIGFRPRSERALAFGKIRAEGAVTQSYIIRALLLCRITIGRGLRGRKWQ